MYCCSHHPQQVHGSFSHSVLILNSSVLYPFIPIVLIIIYITVLIICLWYIWEFVR
jgi:hypothetical protein